MEDSSDSESSDSSRSSREYERNAEEEEEELGEGYPLYEIKDFILACPDFDWPWGQGLTKHSTINLSCQTFVIPELVEHFPHKPWDWSELSESWKISFDFIDAHPDFPWDWEVISARSGIPPELVLNNIDKPWDWYTLTKCVVRTTREFQENLIFCLPDKPWDWEKLTDVMNLEFIEAHPSLNWNWHYIITKRHLDLDFIDRHAEKLERQTWVWLSRDEVVKEWVVEKYIDKPWDWTKLSENQNFTPEFIHSHIDKDWYWPAIGRNESITPSFFARYINKSWRIPSLFDNQFKNQTGHKRKREKNEKEEWLRSTRLNTGGDTPIIRNIMACLYFD